MKSAEHLLRAYNESPLCDWDLIVISSRDESQRRAFEQQLDQMKRSDRHFITNNYKFLVVSDDEFTNQTNRNSKIGSGGSTIYIFKYLAQRFGQNFFNTNKVLLIHSGGYSQRLPHYSVLGKLFSNLPIDLNSGNKYWTALDVKLSLLSPMASLMLSGVWVTASDDIVIYSYEDSELKDLPKFSADSVVCLGHPSNLDISVNHGVYVVSENDFKSIKSSSVSLLNCLKVLQKPTVDELIQFKGIIREENKEYCITDSSYYLGTNIITEKMLKFAIETSDQEIDCYGHFLCPLGSEPITKEPKSRFKSPLNELLIGTDLKILYLSKSRFFHLGTLAEYIFEMTDYTHKELAKSLHFKQNGSTDVIQGTVVCSKINGNSFVDKQSVIEFCDFSSIDIETNNNLLYNCQYTKRANDSFSVIKFPANYLIFSVPVMVEDKDGLSKGWSTFACLLHSDIKSGLWSQKVFPVCETSSESLVATLDLINDSGNHFCDRIKLSMADIKDVKDIDAILNFQNKLKYIQ